MRQHIERERMSLEVKVGSITKLLKKAKTKFLKFTQLLAKDGGRYDKAVTFIAILDMAKDGVLKAEQDAAFEEIRVKGA